MPALPKLFVTIFFVVGFSTLACGQELKVSIPDPPDVADWATHSSSTEQALARQSRELSTEKKRIIADLKKFNIEVADGVDESKVAFYETWQKRIADDVDAYKRRLVVLAREVTKRQATIDIGSIGAISGDVWLVDLLGNKTKLTAGKSILFKSKISTGPTGRMTVRLNDETTFTIGPDSNIVLDEVIYDPNTTVGKVSAQITKGVFRFVTGKVAKKRPGDMKIKTPVGDLGFRGTELIADVAATGQTTITMLSGEIDVTFRNREEPIVVRAGSQVTIAADGKSATTRTVKITEIERAWREANAPVKP